MKEEMKVSRDLKVVATLIDEALHELTGTRMGFSLVVFPINEKSSVNYISNCKRSEVKEALETLLNHWNDGMPDAPLHHKN